MRFEPVVRSGRRLAWYRRRRVRRHAGLQARKTRSAKRLLKKRARWEVRQVRPINHQMSRAAVAVAQLTGCGITLEQLQGIRERVTVSRAQRA